MAAAQPSQDNTLTYAYTNTAYFLVSAASLLITTLYASPTEKATIIQQMLTSIFLLVFGAFNIPQFFPYTWLHWASVLTYHTITFVRGYTAMVGGGDERTGTIVKMLASGALLVWGIGLLVFAGEGKRARSTYLFTPEEKRKMKVEKREKRFGKLEGKMG